MAEINVREIKPFPDALFEVEVVTDATTVHRVHLNKEYYRKLTAGEVAADKLIKRSFEFLLEREPNTMILTEFELSVIGKYFPDFEEVISKTTAK